MNMVGHYNKITQFNIFPYFGCFNPFVVCNVSVLVQYHCPVFDCTKQTGPVLCNHSYEIQPCLRIIVSFEADAAAMVYLRVVGHFIFIFSLSYPLGRIAYALLPYALIRRPYRLSGRMRYALTTRCPLLSLFPHLSSHIAGKPSGRFLLRGRWYRLWGLVFLTPKFSKPNL